jgi:hypothetical protein
MTRKLVAALLFAFVIVLAGCSGGGGTGAGDRTTTDAPAGTTTVDDSDTPGTDDPGMDDDVPTAAFQYEYSQAEGTLTITYVGGDNVAADQLRVDGQNLGGSTGIWSDLPGAEASMTVAGERSLGLQDSVTLGGAEGQQPIPSDYAVELVWVADSGTETVIGSDSGTADVEPPASEDPDDWAGTDARAALEAAGSYTTTWDWRSNVDDTGEMTFTARVDFGAERTHNTMRIGGEEVSIVETYYADGIQYHRFASGDGSDASYFQSESSFSDTFTSWDFGYGYDRSALEGWVDQGTESYDGVTVRRYVFEASDEYLDDEYDSEFDVTSTRFELLVDRDGIPRYQRYEVEGSETDGTRQWFEWELTVSDVGSTTVAEPAWVRDARTQ